MTISEMRTYIMHQYPNRIEWHRKVRNMPTNQVVAIYYSMKNRAAKKKKKEESEKRIESQYHQIDMWEYLASISQNHTDIKLKDKLSKPVK